MLMPAFMKSLKNGGGRGSRGVAQKGGGRAWPPGRSKMESQPDWLFRARTLNSSKCIVGFLLKYPLAFSF